MSSVRGTRDLIPSEFEAVKYLFGVWRSECERFGFSEYDLPVLESFELFEKKSGEALVNQTYNFLDKSDRRISLRPELTPQLGRVFLEKGKGLSKPLKWFSVPRCFRYERPQKGRLREFFQLNADIVGSNSSQVNVEIISLAVNILKRLGLGKKDFYIKISSRELLDIFLKDVESKSQVFGVIDDKPKIGEKDFVKRLKDLGLNKREIDWVNSFTSIKDKPSVALKKIKKLSADEKLLPVLSFFEELIKGLEYYGVLDFVIFDFSIVRGLAYYKGIVFEAFDKSEGYRSILGGGSYFFENTPAIGFGFGDAVILEVLKEKKLIPVSDGLDFFVIMDKNTIGQGFKFVNKLRSEGFSVSYDFDFKSFDKQLSVASKFGAKKVIFLGEKEIKSGTYLLKDLSSGKQFVKSLEI